MFKESYFEEREGALYLEKKRLSLPITEEGPFSLDSCAFPLTFHNDVTMVPQLIVFCALAFKRNGVYTSKHEVTEIGLYVVNIY